MSPVVRPETNANGATTGRLEVDYSLAMIKRAGKRMMYQRRAVEKLRIVGAPRSLAVAIDILAAMEAKHVILTRRHDRLLAEACNRQEIGPEQSSQISI